MEIPSSAAGVVEGIKVAVGDKVQRRDAVAGAGSEARRRPPRAAAALRRRPRAARAGRAAAAAPALAPAIRAGGPHRARPRRAGARTEVGVPDIGDFDEVAVIEVLVKPGDTIRLEQSLVTVESDKASMEIPSSAAGRVAEEMQGQGRRQGDEGQRARAGREQRRCGGAARRAAAAPCRRGPPRRATTLPASPAPAAAPAAPAPPPAERTLPTAALPAHEPTAPAGPLPHASPSVRKLRARTRRASREVKGSGPKGRITQEDVQGFVKGVMAGASRPRRRRPRRRAAAGGGGGAPGPAALAQGRLREVRPDRAQGRCRASRRSAAPTCTATG